MLFVRVGSSILLACPAKRLRPPSGRSWHHGLVDLMPPNSSLSQSAVMKTRDLNSLIRGAGMNHRQATPTVHRQRSARKEGSFPNQFTTTKLDRPSARVSVRKSHPRTDLVSFEDFKEEPPALKRPQDSLSSMRRIYQSIHRIQYSSVSR